MKRSIVLLVSTLWLVNPASTEEPSECEVTAVELTDGYAAEWHFGTYSIDGHAQAVVRQSDAAQLKKHSRALYLELSAIVSEETFGMLGICHPEGANPGKPRESWQEAHAEMVRRLDRRAGSGIIRDVRCSFGWSHYE